MNPASAGAALGRPAKASAGVRRPIARCGLTGVVVDAEPVEVGLKLGETHRGVTLGEPLLLRLVEPLPTFQVCGW